MANQYTVPDAAETTLLNWQVRALLTVPESLLLRVYKNDYTPDRNSVLASFTPADFAGYLQKIIARGDWAAPVLTDHTASVEPTPSPYTFACTAGTQTVYGVYLVGATSLIVCYCRRFAVPRVVTPTSPLLVRPVITLSSPQVLV